MDEGQNNENRGINRGDTNGNKGKKRGDKKGKKGKKSGDNNGNQGKKYGNNNGKKGKKPGDKTGKYRCRAGSCDKEFPKLRGLYDHLRVEHKKVKVCPEPRCNQVFYTEHEEDDHITRTKHGAAKTPKELLDKQGK